MDNKVLIKGTETEDYWTDYNGQYIPEIGFNNTNRRAAYSSSFNNIYSYNVDTTEITELFRLAQNQHNYEALLEAAKQMDILSIAICNQNNEIFDYSVEEFKVFLQYVADNNGLQNDLFVGFNNFKFSNLLLKAHGIDISRFKTVDLFLDIYRSVAAAYNEKVIDNRTGYNLENIALNNLSTKREKLPKKIWEYLNSQDPEEIKIGKKYSENSVKMIKELMDFIREGKPIKSNQNNLEIELKL